MVCLECGDPACAASLAVGTPCDCNEFLGTLQQSATGTYNAPTFAALPAGLRTLVTDNLIAAARKETSAVGAPPGVNAFATGIYNGGAPFIGPANAAGVVPAAVPWYEQVDGLAGNFARQLTALVRLYQNTQAERANILGHLEALTLEAGTAASRLQAKDAVGICNSFSTALTAERSTKSLSADALANERHPLCRLYFLCAQVATSDRMSLDQIGLTTGRLDDSTGKPSQTFKKLPAITSTHQLHMCIQHFKDALLVVGKNGCRSVWAPFWEAILGMMDSKNDPAYIHELIFRSLTDMETKKQPVWTWFKDHWVQFLILFTTKWGENGRPLLHDPAGEAPDLDGDYDEDKSTGARKGKGVEHVKFGDVTQFFSNGDAMACGEMRTRSGAVAFCNKWNESKPCNRGVFAGKNKGKCAYMHKCRWCSSSKHKGEEVHAAGHAEAGEPVCGKHPSKK